MKRTRIVLVTIFCILFHTGLSYQESEEAVDDSIDEENLKLNGPDSIAVEDDNENEKYIEEITKNNELNSEVAEDDQSDVSIKKKKLQYPGIEDVKAVNAYKKFSDGDSEAASDDDRQEIMGLKENIDNSENREQENDGAAKLSDGDSDAAIDDAKDNDRQEVTGSKKRRHASNSLFMNKFPVIKNEEIEMEKAMEAGDASDLFGTNQHYNIPANFQDFGRRFVLTYPYIEKNNVTDDAEAKLDNIVKKYLISKKTINKQLTPVKAPPEFVLQIAKQSALLEASKPKNPTSEIIQKDILRTGKYWDDVWIEKVDNMDKILRTANQKNKLDSISVNIPAGSKLHALLSMLKNNSPRFLYVINKKVERYNFVLISS